jgi:zinc transporter ZupT
MRATSIADATPVLVSLLTFVSTSAGGLFALRHRRRLHLVLGFTAGVLLGVVAFDVLPELFELAARERLDPAHAMVALVAGFLVFHSVEKLVLIHHAHELSASDKHHPTVGLLSALALAGHSFMDGVGIGLGFQVSSRAGFLVALAVISHDFADGLNTVGLMLAHRNRRLRTLAMLALDAATPVAGAASTLLFRLEARDLALYLGSFAGFLLYIGASDVLPEAHSRHSSPALIGLTALGAAFIFLVTRAVG